jgi:hypothetical protein
LPEELRTLVEKFPPGCLQFEVGIQTFDAATSERIRRKQNVERTRDNLRFLREQTGVHVHADLIVGLPGEDIDSFARGFDQLLALGPQEIQVGILKRLRGTPISRHDLEWDMVYSPLPPYEILSNRLIPFEMMMRMKRFARAWDLIANSGHFVASLPLLLQSESPFRDFLAFTDWLSGRVGAFSGIALARLSRLLSEYQPSPELARALEADFARKKRAAPSLGPRQGVPPRQARHLAS